MTKIKKVLIEKQFSSYDDYGYEDERVYSVLMNEDELRLYSEFLEEREYSRDMFMKKPSTYYSSENQTKRLVEGAKKWGETHTAGDRLRGLKMSNGTYSKSCSNPEYFKNLLSAQKGKQPLSY